MIFADIILCVYYFNYGGNNWDNWVHVIDVTLCIYIHSKLMRKALILTFSFWHGIRLNSNTNLIFNFFLFPLSCGRFDLVSHQPVATPTPSCFHPSVTVVSQHWHTLLCHATHLRASLISLPRSTTLSVPTSWPDLLLDPESLARRRRSDTEWVPFSFIWTMNERNLNWESVSCYVEEVKDVNL